jgi:diguanylate cyclase (GGDEF)-like protein/PAS domain S-box-containing protein
VQAQLHEAQAAVTALLTRGESAPRMLSFLAPGHVVHLLATILPRAMNDLEAGVAGLCLGAGAAYLAQRRRAARQVPLGEERSQFLAATESALDAFYIFDSVHDSAGALIDFRFRYLNARGEEHLKRHREDLLGKRLCEEFPWIREQGLFDEYSTVVATGVPFMREFAIDDATIDCRWVRHQVVKMGDGVALTSSDLSKLKAAEQRYRELAAFNDSIFEHAPFSMIATDGAGTITAMNAEAERITGYDREELVGRTSMLLLHDPEELQQRAERVSQDLGITVSGFDLITMPHADGDTREEDWTYVRRDGTRSPINLTLKVMHGENGERTSVIGIAQEVSNRKQRTSYVANLMTHDPLTGLLGRGLLDDRIAQAIERAKRSKNKVAVFLIDLDQFRRINDSLGHRVGDEILTLVAARLLKTVRSSDTVARLGGDEFMVVMPDQTESASIEFCAEKLRRAVSSPYLVRGNQVTVTASVGLCTYPDLAGSSEHLMQRTDAAMHAAKQGGRNRYQVFTATMLEAASSRISMEGALRLAAERDELFVQYQPQIALPGGEVIGMEALLRWKHPQLGLVSPAHFIPMAEELGLMADFGAWVIKQACREAKQIQNELGRSLMLSVNLSPHQFQPHQIQDKKLVKIIEEALRLSGLAPSDLEIEITENTLMINSTANLQTLQSIRDLGVKLSIDDFGTGFSSFSYLLQYHVDRLKIDQSFVRQAVGDANAASVVRTIIAMSHGLNIRVIAEGVETRDQLKFLMRRRCDEAQGFYFARAVSADEFVATVERIEAMPVDEIALEIGATRKRESSTSEDVLKTL